MSSVNSIDEQLESIKLRSEDGIYLLEEPASNVFEELYYKLRIKEGRIFTNEILMALPYYNHLKGKVHRKEWKALGYSLRNLINYLPKNFSASISILDLECGNGWMTNAIALSGRHKVMEWI